tara:strand:- start:121 stop:435 length:315 start_codon:yes stop_codon:yes gene_type:complete
MDTLHFILCSYGMTFILIYGSIFNKIRPTKGKLGELFHCPLCLGFWVGIILWAMNGRTELFSFDNSLYTAFLCGCLSAGTSYFFSMLLKDFGLNLNVRLENEKT